MNKDFKAFIRDECNYTETKDYYEFPILKESEGLKANAYYFNNFDWATEYLTFCHRNKYFEDRWNAAVGDMTGKIIVDIGCGPGNIFATLGGTPECIIGVDVAPGSLKIAQDIGYTTVLADAHNLPFKPAIADVVMLNATLHHCEDMKAVLKEAAKLVKPGGILITDHDPQYSAWNYKGLAKLLWNLRLSYYRVIGHGFHKSGEQQKWGLACEIHHKPGDGVSNELFNTVLEPQGFAVTISPHNHQVGAGALLGDKGKAELKYRLGNLLSGRNPSLDKSALTLMCVARKLQIN
jgi:ubiquinone/menaquinone biosynthesis C-methylase UbiE